MLTNIKFILQVQLNTRTAQQKTATLGMFQRNLVERNPDDLKKSY